MKTYKEFLKESEKAEDKKLKAELEKKKKEIDAMSDKFTNFSGDTSGKKFADMEDALGDARDEYADMEQAYKKRFKI